MMCRKERGSKLQAIASTNSQHDQMEDRMSYAWESFSQAVRALASGDTQRERLLRAYKMHLMQLTKKDVPREIREEFDRLVIEIRRCSAKEGRNLKRIADNVGDHEVASMVDSIIQMYDAVTRYQPLPAPSEHAA
jgi:hypothetical protein